MGDIEMIKALIVEYYEIEYGYPIHNHLELLKFDDEHEVYISRRSLKHFVDRRKQEMSNSYTDKEIINSLNFAMHNCIVVYSQFDKVEPKFPNRLIYSKYFEIINKNLRVVLESVRDRLEICSIHFQKNKKPP